MLLKTTDFFLLRTPGFSINNLFELNNHIQERDIHAVKKAFLNEEFLKAIYLSSRYFYRVAIKWLQEETSFDKEDKIFNTLYKYYSRICTRATPYGLFAGFSTGDISAGDTRIELGENHWNPQIRVDLLALRKIKDSIINNNENFKKIVYYPNNTIYKLNSMIRYVEWDKNYSYSISDIDANFILEKILQSAKEGITYDEIINIILEIEAEAPQEDIDAYIEFLFQNKILVDRLPPYLTDINDPVVELERQFNSYQIDSDRTKILKEIRHINNEINIDEIEKIYEENEDILHENLQLFQVDLKLNLTQNSINEKIIKKLTQAAVELKGIAVHKEVDEISTFHRKFYEKYEGEEIQLIKALDPQLGIGYGLQTSGNVEETPLLQNIFFSYPNKEIYQISPIVKRILTHYTDFLSAQNGKPIVLTKKDIDSCSINQEDKDLHETYYLFGEILSASPEKMDENNFKFFNKASAVSPNYNTVLSRFAYHDEKLRSRIQELSEGSSDVIYAEIINSSNDRLGNVSLRPNFYPYEIPYISETKEDKVKISIDDIMISIKNNEIVLRSKSLNKRIRPVMSTAYNYHLDQLSIIRFLGDIQYYNIYRGFRWEWGALEDSIYLPRVEYKEMILSEARWRLLKKAYTVSELKTKLSEYNIPRYCNIKELDNVLLLDTENEVCLTLLLAKLAKHDVVLYESFIESSFIRKENEKYAGEFVFPLVNDEKKEKTIVKEIEIPNDVRNFYPGEEWSYFKIYCSHKIGDQILTEVIQPFIQDISSTETPAKWFFIRYNDPENHIRFRINRKLDHPVIELFNLYAKKFLDQKLISKIQIDTYTREIERYLSFGIEDAEELFFYDSEAIQEFIRLSDSGDNENIRWMTAVVSIDMLLDDFKISSKDRLTIFENLYQQFLPEFVDVSTKEYLKGFKTSIDAQYRQYRYFFDEVIHEKDLSGIQYYIEPFIKRGIRTKNLLEKKKDISEEDLLQFLKNAIHMSLNRLFYTKARMYELLIYFFLFQSYKSKILRNGPAKKYAQ
ncbi:lantibiotic dehydratase [Chryseobacterium daecheongense]|uniref:Thiopeptide-type bacteriocin biosynthesis protein n=1 Tax=Chryseobacterium daecheongense TaxID=192389 RepID=A0A3N0W4R2_9FLAO|nr:lantibiotic dehydratase [Chryseobacterium daecheongense]ROI00038.1 hypothetical protein EGI05_03880 [Chryseobacterium daecheongense]TDX95025.1 thiopeptide-type bacteriocin biosynthesis protein [Chryseobacterium daecheongense]